MTIKPFKLLLLFSLIATLANAELPDMHYRFTHLSVDDGLASNSITSVVQDSSGFIWISSYHGLHRYDSYEFKLYHNDLDDSTSLNSNSIYGLFIDRKNILWVKTVGNGLNQYDVIKDRFIHYVNDPNNPHSISGNYIKDITEDKNHNFWIATWDGGLCFMNRKTKQFKRILADPSDKNGLHKDNIMISSVVLDQEGILWIGSTQGLFSYDPKTSLWYRYPFNRDQSTHLNIPDISKVYIAPDNKIWIGSWGGGLKYVDKKTKTLKHFPQHQRYVDTHIDDRVFSLYHDSHNNFWGSLEGGGLIKIFQETDSIVRIKHEPGDPHSLMSNSIFSMYQDRNGLLWIASHFGGINLLSLENQQFHHIYPLQDNPNHLSGSVIHCFAEDKEGNIWIGTHGNGINIFNPKTKKFNHLKHKPKTQNSISSVEIRAIEPSQHGGVWIGTASGLDYYIPKTGEILHYKHDPNDNNSLGHNLIFALKEDKNGNLWVGTYNAGLSYLNFKTQTFTHYRYDPDDSTSVNSNIIQNIYIDSKERLWIATRSGLNLFQPETQQFIRFFSPKKKKQSTHLTSIFEDHAGVYWITGNTGLIRFELDANNTLFNVMRITQKDGLSSNMVTCVLEDKQHHLWISTAYGLNRYDPVTQNNIIYTKYDGLQDNMFNENASYYSAKTGLMYFGGSNGFNMFNPEKIHNEIDSSPILLTDLKLYNQSVVVGKKYNNSIILHKPIHLTRSIQLNHRENSFTLKFAAMNFKGIQQNQYACRLMGFETAWNYIDKKHEATYTNLDPGNYRFEVKRVTKTGKLSPKTTTLNIHISPPFWQQWWFRILTLLIIIIAIYAIYEYKVYSLKKNQQILEQKIKERTEALSNSNKELEQFAYVASHDLQEPLRMITSYLQLLEKRYTAKLDEDAKEFIHFAVDGAKRMQMLITDLLSYSRISTQGKAFESVNMKEITDYAVMNLELSIEENEAQINYDALPIVQADSIQMERLMQNLIGNAIKYRKKEETPVVHISANQQDNQWIFAVKDNSIGIPEDQFDRIFNVFQRLHGRNEYSGTGIGLASCKKIVERHGGKIWVESKVDAGSTFYFTLPAT